MSYAVGLMSGTSLDGVDAALVEINGLNEETIVELIDFNMMPFTKDTVRRIQNEISIEKSSVAAICSLNFELGYLFSEAAKLVCKKANFPIEKLDFIASHGQTLYHLPVGEKDKYASTFQIGEPAVLCEELKTTVVSNFRPRDMVLEGQGAPIVPYQDYILYRNTERKRMLQNIGGIGNVTIIPKNAELNDVLAFDTGPGNMVIDELCRIFYQIEYDENGEYASLGNVNQALLKEMMSHPYIIKDFPKTTGREEFGKEYVQNLVSLWQVQPNDFIATATMFTAKSIAESIKPFIEKDTDLIIGGGGSYNHTLISMLKNQLPNVNIMVQEEMGFSSEAKEAIAMTILANQTIHHLPSNVPNATGARKETILGNVTYYD